MPQDGKPARSTPAPDWRDLAAQASHEPDPKKLTELVKEICDRLDENESIKKPVQSVDEHSASATEDRMSKKINE